jgi:hypothetical protein
MKKHAPHTTCLPLLRSTYKNLTKSEQKIADYILNHPKTVIHMTISDLAEASTSAEATAFRFCHKLGFSGFQELKMALAGDVLSPMKSLSQEVNLGDDTQTISQKVFKNIIGDLQATLKILDYRELQRAVEALASARKIDAYGYGGSGVIALDIQHRYVRLGLQVNAYTDPHLQIASAALLNRRRRGHRHLPYGGVHRPLEMPGHRQAEPRHHHRRDQLFKIPHHQAGGHRPLRHRPGNFLPVRGHVLPADPPGHPGLPLYRGHAPQVRHFLQQHEQGPGSHRPGKTVNTGAVRKTTQLPQNSAAT